MSISNLLIPNDLELHCANILIEDEPILNNAITPISFSGPWNNPIISDIHFSRSGNIISAIITPTINIGTIAAPISSDVQIPLEFRPINDFNSFVVQVISNNVQQFGVALVRADGFLRIYSSAAEDDFSGAGNDGWGNSICLTWNLVGEL